MRYITLSFRKSHPLHFNTSKVTYDNVLNARIITPIPRPHLCPIELRHGIYELSARDGYAEYAIPETHPFFTINAFNAFTRSLCLRHNKTFCDVSDLYTEYFNNL